MAEYISREAVNNLIEDMQSNHLLLVSERTNLAILKSKVAELPAADVQPVKRGQWSECYTDNRLYSGICSVCSGGAIRSVKANPLDYCPNCGARMGGDVNDYNDK